METKENRKIHDLWSTFLRSGRDKIRKSYNYFFLSMRRKVGIDFALLYILISVMVTTVLMVSFYIYHANEQADRIFDKAMELVRLHEQTEQLLEEELKEIVGENDLVSIQVRQWKIKKKRLDYLVSYQVKMSVDFQANMAKTLDAFFKKGQAKHIYWIKGEKKTSEVTIVQDISQFSEEWHHHLGTLVVAQFIGVLVLLIIGMARLRTVFKPIYNITRVAKKISVDNMHATIDVSKAEYELKDLVFTLNDMLHRIGKDYAKQKRFVSDVSHELRTPISILSGYARMLDRWGKNDKEVLEEAIKAIKDESRNMQTLVEGLLFLVRFDNHTLEFEKEEFDLSTLILDICRDMEMVDEGKHHFSHVVEQNLNVRLDYSKTKQALRVFMDNAMKYTLEGGSISIEAKIMHSFVTIDIRDTGIGIPKEDLPRLFERFYRSDTSRTRETGGYGLGLSIAKAIIIGQNGRLRVKSKENEGSTFTLILPLIF